MEVVSHTHTHTKVFKSNGDIIIFCTDMRISVLQYQKYYNRFFFRITKSLNSRINKQYREQILQKVSGTCHMNL